MVIQYKDISLSTDVTLKVLANKINIFELFF